MTSFTTNTMKQEAAGGEEVAGTPTPTAKALDSLDSHYRSPLQPKTKTKTAAPRRSIAIVTPPSNQDEDNEDNQDETTAENRAGGVLLSNYNYKNELLIESKLLNDKLKDTSNNNNNNKNRRRQQYLVHQAASASSTITMNPPQEELPQDQLQQQQRTLQLSHSNSAAEQDQTDAIGQQGGQQWAPPTHSPSLAPTTLTPSLSPTGHPTLSGKEFTLRGVVWYDRNANGVRDSNVEAGGMGRDVEYSHGVGGVGVMLVECDKDTGRAQEYGNADANSNSYASTFTQGFSGKMVPGIVPTNEGMNGKYNIHLRGLDRYYYVLVTAPVGYLFTNGVCDEDAAEGSMWACGDLSLAIDSSAEMGGVRDRKLDRDRSLQATGIPGATRIPEATGIPGSNGSPGSAENSESALGIVSGRSTKCVYIDKSGKVQAPINFGVMREGDTQKVGTLVALVLEFDESGADTPQSLGRDRRLARILERARVLDERDDGTTITTRYLLDNDDKRAIGTVTAEVLASNLDRRLANEGVELDSVVPKDVTFSNARPSKSADAANGGAAGSNQLAVSMEIKGHYSPPPNIDFDYIVEDSINKDAPTIRRDLQEYNHKCKDQAKKVQGGSVEEDFDAVVSTSGAARPGRGGGRPVSADVSSMNNVYSTACSSDLFVPDYFETSLQEVVGRKPSDVKFDSANGGVVYVAEESRGLESWAMGPVAGIAGLIVLLAGAFVFRRALGPRRVDKYSEMKTKDVDGDGEMRRFGEAGGAMDDGSVDSAFYSESDDDSDLEETEKERKMRRKRKEKDDEQRKGGDRGDRGLSSKTKEARERKKRSNGDPSKSQRRTQAHKMSVSQGSDDTDSLGKYSSSSGEMVEKNREKKRATKERNAEKKSSKQRSGGERDSERKSSSKRGRNRKSGGDNTRIV